VSAAPARAEEVASTPHFVFYSDPWVNLHHFLYHEARNTLRGDERLRGRVRTYHADREVTLTDEERGVFDEALAIYATYGDKQLIFDETLLTIGIDATKGPEAFPTGEEAEPAYRALRMAMPVYKRHWWPRHDATNRRRIAELMGYLESYGAAMAELVAAGYGCEWPADPVRVDVTNYSGRHGAYAHSEPNRIVFASPGDWYPGLLGLDVLFHEVGHTLPFEEAVTSRSEAAAEAAGVEEGDVWHAFLFFVPSEAARQVLPDDHVPYAYFDDGPLVEGRMSRAEPYIRRALAETDDLDTVFRLIHEARAAAAAD
jgi:hypothetical protein